MRNNRNIFILVLISILFVGSACKKYDEGPLISLRSKEKRLCQKWKLYEAYWNGEQTEINSTEVEYKTNGKYHSKYITTTDTIEENYDWQWDDNKSNIKVFGTEYTYYFSYYDSTSGQNVYDSVLYNYSAIFKIQKLTQKELWYDLDTVIYNEPTTISYRFKSED